MCGFYDSRIHTVSLRAVKNSYLVLADVHFSLQFLKWEEAQSTVVMKSEDQQHLHVRKRDVATTQVLYCSGGYRLIWLRVLRFQLPGSPKSLPWPSGVAFYCCFVVDLTGLRC